LKSSVRIRPSIPTQVELFEINKLDSINTKTEVELPFDTDKSSIINTEENIFSKEICEAPYKEETNVISTNKEIVNIVYRPSSPILNE